MSTEERKQMLTSAAEIIAQISEEETNTSILVARSMQLGYDLAKAETAETAGNE